jgi:hypothetical protein
MLALTARTCSTSKEPAGSARNNSFLIAGLFEPGRPVLPLQGHHPSVTDGRHILAWVCSQQRERAPPSGMERQSPAKQIIQPVTRWTPIAPNRLRQCQCQCARLKGCLRPALGARGSARSAAAASLMWRVAYSLHSGPRRPPLFSAPRWSTAEPCQGICLLAPRHGDYRHHPFSALIKFTWSASSCAPLSWPSAPLKSAEASCSYCPRPRCAPLLPARVSVPPSERGWPRSRPQHEAVASFPLLGFVRVRGVTEHQLG